MPPVINPLTLSTSISPSQTPPTSIPIFNVEVDVSTNNVQEELLQNSMANVFVQYLNQASKENSNTLSDVYSKGVNASRYPNYNPDLNNEDAYAQNQSIFEKGKNGILKGVGLAATTFVNGTAGLIYGGYSWAKDGRFASLFDNELSRKLDEINTSMEDVLPNYYTEKETNASWYSPSNIFTANFLFDKLIKNAGFTVGAIGGGAAWTKALSIIGKATSLTKAGQSIKPLVTALEEANTIVDPIERAAKITSITEGMTLGENITLGAIKASANTNRILTSTFGTFGEAGIEALQATNQQRQTLIDEYIQANGVSPTGDDLKRINEFADRTGGVTFALNSALLTGTNYIQLPKILGSKYGASKLVSNGVETELNAISRNASGEAVTAFSKLGKASRIATKTKNALGVFLSPSESFEEGSQFAISEGVNNFYKKKYEAKEDLGNWLNEIAQGTLSKEGLYYGVDKTIHTKEGMESLLLGALSGGMMQAGFVSRKGFGKTGELGKRGFFGQTGEKGKNTEEAISNLNKTNIAEALADQVRTQNAAINIAKDQTNALAQDNKYSFKNSQADYTFNYLQSRIKYGKTDWVLQDLEQYKQLASTVEGFETLKQQGVVQETQTKEEFLQQLEKVKTDALFINQAYERLNLTYGGKMSKSKVVYTPEHIEALAYLQYKMKDVTERSADLTSKVISANVSVSEYLDEYLNTGELSNESLTKFENTLKENKYLTEDEQNEIIDNFTSVLQLEKDRASFVEEYNEIAKNPEYLSKTLEEYNDIANNKEETDKITSINITTPLGDKSLDLNKFYSIVKEEGKEYSFPTTFTIVQENPDGSLLVKDRLGKKHFVSKEELASFRLAKSTEAQGDNKSFFLYTITPEEIEQKKKEDEFLANATKVAEVNNENKEIEGNSGDVITNDTTETVAAFQPPKKETSIYFSSSKEPSTEFNNLTGMAKKRQNLFYAIKKSNRKFVAKLITPSLQEAANLPNVLNALYDADKIPVNHADDSTGKATIAVVYLQEDKEGSLFYVNEEGEIIKNLDNQPIKFGQPLSIEEQEQLVLGVLPSSNDRTENGVAYRETEKEEFYKQLELYKQERADFLQIASVEDSPLYDVSVSHGFLVSKTVDGKPLPKVHVSNLITEKIIKTNEDVVFIPKKTDTIKLPSGESKQVYSGQPMLKFGDQYYDLNNRKLTKEEKETIKDLFLALASKFEFGSRKLDRTILSYLQHVLYYGKGKSETLTPNQIAIVQEEDLTATPTIIEGVTKYPKPFYIKMGQEKVKFDKVSLSLPENQAILESFLEKAYNNVNTKTLESFKNDPFVEIIGIKKDKENNFVTKENGDFEFVTRTWSNYRTYLLSSKNPDNTSRSVEATPLTIRMQIPQGSVKESPIVDQYSIFTNKPALIEKKKIEKEQIVLPFSDEKFDAITEALQEEEFNVFDTQEKKLIVFANEILSPKYSEEELKKQVDLYIARYNLTKENKLKDFNETFSEEIEQSKQETIELEVSNIEAKKADIERRRQKSLNAIEQRPNETLFTAPYYKEGYNFKQLPTDSAMRTEAEEKEYYEILKNNNALTDVSIQVKTIEEAEKLINAKYDAELKALEQPEVTSEQAKELNAVETPVVNKPAIGTGFDLGNFRREFNNSSKSMTDADWNIFKEWINKNLPDMPVYELQEMIRIMGTDRKAWGMLKDNALHIFKYAPKGTEYHESFEFVWNLMLNPEQQAEIIAELKMNNGVFFDINTQTKVAFNEASTEQLKEFAAEQFAKYKRTGETITEKLKNFFENLLSTIRNFFLGNRFSKLEQLFSDIDSAKFKNQQVNKSEITAYKKAPGLTELQTKEIVDTLYILFNRDLLSQGAEGLFNINKEGLTDTDLIDQKINSLLAPLTVLNEAGEYIPLTSQPESVRIIRDNLKAKLKSLGISFEKQKFSEETLEEEEEQTINDDGRASVNYAPEAMTLDHRKGSFPSVKLNLSSLYKTIPIVASIREKLQKPKPLIKGAGFLEPVDFAKTFVTIMKTVSPTLTVDKMETALINLAKKDSDFTQVLLNYGLKLENNKFDFDNFNASDWRMFIQLFNTFAKQNPTPVNFITSEGNVTMQNAILQRETEKVKNQWITNIKVFAKETEAPVKYDERTKQFSLNSDFNNKYNDIKNLSKAQEYLDSLGIVFSDDNLSQISKNPSLSSAFLNTVKNVNTYLLPTPTYRITTDSLSIGGPLQKLSEIYTSLNTQNFNSTYYGLDGRARQQFDNHNFPSKVATAFNSASTKEELLTLLPHLKDSFSQHSIFLRMDDAFMSQYFNEEGDRNTTPFQISTFNAILDTDGVAKTQDSLKYNERLTYTINNLLNNNHYIILPADSATEWMINFENPISIKSVLDESYENNLTEIFKGYLIDEINVALEASHRSKNKFVAQNGAKDLRFLKEMISKELNDKVAKVINEEVTFEEFWQENQEQFKNEIIATLKEKSASTKRLLLEEGELLDVSNRETKLYSYPSLDDNYRKNAVLSVGGYDKNKMTEKDVSALMDYFTINYAISNIEMFKMMFGDPHQFEVKSRNGKPVLDVFKRIKSWESPRRTLFTDPRFDNFANGWFNKVNEVELSPLDPGYNNFSSLKRSVTISLSATKGLGKNNEDVIGSMVLSSIPEHLKPAYEKVTEADASSGVSIMKYREIKLKTGQWTDEAEEWYQQEMAYTRQRLSKLKKYSYTNESLAKQDKELVKERKKYINDPQFIIDILKPIVTGPKFVEGYNEQELDKTSMMPIYFSMTEIREYNSEEDKKPTPTILQDLFLAMMENNIDYYTFPSGKKVGITDTHYVYNEDGSFNTNLFKDNKSVTIAPLDNLGIQVETTYEGGKGQTMGSQTTKVVSMDLLDGGKPADTSLSTEDWNALSEEEKENESPIYKLIKLNDKYRTDLVINGYEILLNKFGITDLGDRFEVDDIEGLQKTILSELERRNLSDNALSSVELNELKTQFKSNLEASNFYGVIKDVLWSIVRKNIVQPTVSGSSMVQIPVAFFESSIEGKTLLLKTEEGYKKVTREEYNQLSPEEQAKVKFGSSALSFYKETILEDGVTRTVEAMEVMLPMWFRKQIKSHKRFKDASDEEILYFLNETEEGKSILQGVGFRIPTQGLNSIEVFKVKAFLPQSMGKSIVVPSEITVKAGSDFDIDKLNTYLYNVWLRPVNGVQTITKVKATNKAKEEVDPMSEEAMSFFLKEAAYYQTLPLEDELLETSSQTQLALNFQKQAIENKYYETMQQLLLHPVNYEKILTPNTTEDLEELSKKLENLYNEESSNLKARLIDFEYITKMRNDFITGKKWVGVVAVNITGHSLFQKFESYVDLNKLIKQSPDDLVYLKDGVVNLPHNTIIKDGKEMTSLSSIRNSTRSKNFPKGQLISDILSQFANAVVDIAKDPFITKIVSSDFTIGTAMFLTRAGVDLETLGFFLNQPIIREYIKALNANRAKSVFNKSVIANIIDKFKTANTSEVKMPSKDRMYDNIKNYYSNSISTKEKDVFNNEQQYILEEFLKYAKLAEYNFKITQATNYDTASFRSGDVLFKKELMYQDAKNNVISSSEQMLKSTFVGEIREKLNDSQSMMGSIFKTEDDFVRSYINKTLEPYARGFYSEENYLKIGIKLSSSFIDYLAIKNSPLLRNKFTSLFSGENNIWKRIQTAKINGINNLFFDYIEPVVSDLTDGSTSLKVTVNKKEAYEQNQLTDALRELKEQDISLYRDVVSAAILQGSAVSPFSFVDSIPVEDYAATVNPIIESLTEEDLKEYVQENAFQRNNWNDKLIVSKVPISFKVEETGMYDPNGNPIDDISIREGQFPQITSYIIKDVNNLSQNVLDYGKKPLFLHRSNSDVLTIDRYQYFDKTYYDVLTGLPDNTIKERRKQNDPSTREIIGYQKVKDENGNPLTNNGKFVFKRINLKGLGLQGNDYQNLIQPSTINNNTSTVNQELPSRAIIDYYMSYQPMASNILYPNISKEESFPEKQITIQDNC